MALALEGLPATGEPSHQVGPHQRLQGVAEGDCQGSAHRARRREIYDEGPDEDGGPDPAPEDEERHQGDSRGGPHRGGAGVHEGELQSELAGHDVNQDQREKLHEAQEAQGRAARHVRRLHRPEGFQAGRGPLKRLILIQEGQSCSSIEWSTRFSGAFPPVEYRCQSAGWQDLQARFRGGETLRTQKAIPLREWCGANLDTGNLPERPIP